MSSIRSVLIFLTLLALTSTAFGQMPQDPKAAREYLQQAEEVFEASRAYDQVRDIAELAAETDTTFVKANFFAGRIRILTINRRLAGKFFLRVARQDPDYQFDIDYWVGKSFQYGLEFDKAIQYFNKYKDKLAKKPGYQGKDRTDLATVDRAIQECVNGKEHVGNPLPVSIINIGDEINSDFDDYGPVINEAEDELVFTTRRRDGNLNENVFEDNLPYEDIYITTKSGDKWAYANNIGNKVNTLYHESSLALSADGSTLFIYNDINGGDILYCERQADGTWGAPIALPGGTINSSFQEKSISISKDEKTLYFTSDRPGGLGGTDIYMATKDSRGHWSNVKNLGPKINTNLNDDGPFIDYDGVTLFFSSQGHNGMGGYDIFKSKFDPKTKEWSDPEHLGYPINTPDNEVYFVVSGSGKAYYSSVREDGKGYTDIYVVTAAQGSIKDAQTIAAKNPEPVKRPDPPKDTVKAVVTKEPVKEPTKQPEPKKELKPLTYVVKVVDSGNKSPLDAKVGLQGQRDNIIVASTSAGDGVYEFKITNPSAKDYRLSIERDGYVFVNQNVRIAGASEQEKTVNRTVEMRKIAVGVSSILRNIYFDYNKAKFKIESYTELNKLEDMLRQNQSIKVEISGHTDANGTWSYNKNLSQKRAEAVKDYLTKKGIDSRRIIAVGYGETKPLASNDDEDDGRELNRRVEFKVLKN